MSKVTTFPSGATRQSSVAGEKEKPVRYDLVPAIGLRRLAETMAHGAEKYGEGNWQKGIPISNCLNHAMAHLVAYGDGDRSEDHIGHALANLCFIAHFEEKAGGGAGILVPEGHLYCHKCDTIVNKEHALHCIRKDCPERVS